MKNNKFINIFLFPLIVCCLAGCNNKDDATCMNFDPITYRTHNYHGLLDKDIVSVDRTFNFDYRTFVDNDNDIFNKSLAETGLLLSAETYDWFDVQIKDKNNEYVKNSKLISYLGASDITHISLKQEDYELDPYDTNSVELAHYEFFYKGKNRQIFFVVFYGTKFDYEWKSDFDIGPKDYDDFYTTNEDPHTEWTNKNNHKGFDIAFNRIKVKINDYINNHKIENHDMIVFTAGHSRGAAIANIYGTYLADNKIDNFTYTFASPNVTDLAISQEEKDGKYNNIFNISNHEDFFAFIMPQEAGFRKYGSNIQVSAKKYKDEYKEFTNINYLSTKVQNSDGTISLTGIFANIITSRDGIYRLSENFNSSIPFSSQEDAIEFYNLCDSLFIKTLNLNDCLKINEPTFDTDTGKWVIYINSSPAFILNLIVYICQTSPAILLIYLPLLPNNGESIATFAQEIVLLGAGIFAYPHMPESYLICIDHVI